MESWNEVDGKKGKGRDFFRWLNQRKESSQKTDFINNILEKGLLLHLRSNLPSSSFFFPEVVGKRSDLFLRGECLCLFISVFRPSQSNTRRMLLILTEKIINFPAKKHKPHFVACMTKVHQRSLFCEEVTVWDEARDQCIDFCEEKFKWLSPPPSLSLVVFPTVYPDCPVLFCLPWKFMRCLKSISVSWFGKTFPFTDIIPLLVSSCLSPWESGAFITGCCKGSAFSIILDSVFHWVLKNCLDSRGRGPFVSSRSSFSPSFFNIRAQRTVYEFRGDCQVCLSSVLSSSIISVMSQ